MGQLVWNVEVDDSTKLDVRKDGTVVVIKTETSSIAELPKEYLIRVAEELNKKQL